MDPAAIEVADARPRAPARVSQPGTRRPVRDVPAPPLPAVRVPGQNAERALAAMVEGLERSGVSDSGVLSAMGAVPRHLFVEAGLSGRAYEDVALPIGHSQTISRPYTVARMLELLAAGIDPGRRARCKVLEIGTGCGYQAAILARVFGEVISIERIRGLHERARTNLRTLRLANLRLVYGDGRVGLPDQAPFDLVIAAAAGDRIPSAWLEQMAVGGSLLAPVAADSGQALHRVTRKGPSNWALQVLDAVRFVPLRDGLA